MHQAGGMESIVNAFVALPKSDACPRKTDLTARTYVPGRHGPIVNVGEGTTGTRFLNCVFQRVGFRTSHNEALSYESLSKYDYVSDNPINMQGAQIFAGHHGGQIPGVILSLRDPKEWAHSRLRHHGAGGARNWRAGPACLGWGGPITDISRMPRSVLTYNAYSACVATSPALRYDDGHLLLINVFQAGRSEEAVDAELARNLSRFLLGHNRSRFLLARDRNNSQITRERLGETSVTKAVRLCAHVSRTGAHTKFSD